MVCSPRGVTFPNHDRTALAFTAALDAPAACACSTVLHHLQKGYPCLPSLDVPDPARWVLLQIYARILVQAASRMGIACRTEELPSYPIKRGRSAGAIYLVGASGSRPYALIRPGRLTTYRANLKELLGRAATFIEYCLPVPPTPSGTYQCLCCPNATGPFTAWETHVKDIMHQVRAVDTVLAMFPPGTEHLIA